MDDLDTSLLRRVAEWMDSRGLLSPGAGVVVGVSGGADSVALLAVLRELSRQDGRGYRLVVAHLDHALRADSPQDAEFVEDLARKWGLPCVVERQEVRSHAGRRGGGIEEAARAVRYEFLRRAAIEAGAQWVAVGHHADDNAETILYRIIRGTHLRGLAGIPSRRLILPTGAAAPPPGACRPSGSVQLVRPLLPLRRADLEGFCRRRGLAWREDPSNADPAYRRNFIRGQLLPLIRQGLSADVDSALLRLAAAAGEVETHLAAQARQLLADCTVDSRGGRIVLDAGRLLAGGDVLAGYALRMALEQVGSPMRALSAERMAELGELARGAGPSAVMLAGGFAVVRTGGQIVIGPAGVGSPPPPQPAVELACPGVTTLADGREVHCRKGTLTPQEFQAHCRHRPDGVEYLDADRLEGPLTVRGRQAGDRFVPLGSPGGQSVGDFLTNLRLPAGRRGEVLCILDGQGIVYLAPLRLAERVKVTPRTQTALRLELRPPWPDGQAASPP